MAKSGIQQPHSNINNTDNKNETTHKQMENIGVQTKHIFNKTFKQHNQSMN